MSALIQLPLDVPDIDVLSTTQPEAGAVLIHVESTLEGTRCHQCGREIRRFHGYDRPIRLRHLPILDQVVWIELRPKRYRCPHCAGGPTTTQRCAWYEPNHSYTKAFAQWVLKLLINSTVADVSRKHQVDESIIQQILDQSLPVPVAWEALERIETLGLDEIALSSGHDSAVTVVSARQEDQLQVLAVLPDRCKATVKTFLASIPPRLKATIQRVCTDMYDGYIHAAQEALPGVNVVADRFHVAKHYHETVDELRKKEMKRLRETLPEADYEPLKGLRWAIRRDWEDLTTEQQYRLVELFKHSPALEKAYIFRNVLTAIFDAPHDKAQASEALKRWRQQVEAQHVPGFASFLTTLDHWFEEITNYFPARHTSGFVEGLNHKIQNLKRRCYGLFDLNKLLRRLRLDVEGYRLFGLA